MYVALFLTMYFGLFRIGKVTQSPQVVLAQNVHVGMNKNKLLFVLYTSKTHNKGSKPQTIKISIESCTNQLCCPFQGIKKFIAIWKKFINNEQFFIFRDRSPVMSAHFRAVLAKSIKWNQLNPSSYSSQGFRASRSSDLLDIGLSVETIKKFGHRRSSAVYTYLRLFMFAGTILANNDAWIIGDNFVNEIFHCYPDWNLECHANNLQQPYLYDYYNVKCYTASPCPVQPKFLQES